jgi:hypothetical protein
MNPVHVSLRVYHVGFGDCFRLTFKYPDSVKHVLIDFGTTSAPTDKPNMLMSVASDIHSACVEEQNAELTAVVATHRHRDHIEGFRTSKNADSSAPGDIIRNLKPKLVIQPWTEDPDIDEAADGPKQHFVKQLTHLHKLSFNVLRDAKAQLFSGMPCAGQLQFLGENNLKNRSAVINLQTMGQQQEYVHFGMPTNLAELLPGVSVRVLGPPTLEQCDEIRKQRQRDDVEFWHLWQKRVAAASRQWNALTVAPSTVEELDAAPPPRPKPIFQAADDRYSNENPVRTRWFRRQLREMRATETLELVRILDTVLNNTSVILLFEFCGKKLLFPGDAQKENWAYALSKPDICELLKDVDLYKVGHHGSLNATPHTLWDLFTRKRSSNNPKTLKTVVSTMAGKHGHIQDGTEVPRTKLLAQLAEYSDLFSTQSLESSPGTLWHDILIHESQ